MRGKWAGSLSVALGLWLGHAAAGEIPWRATGQPDPIAPAASDPPARPCIASFGRPVPIASFGQPVPVATTQAALAAPSADLPHTETAGTADPYVIAASYSDPVSRPIVVRAEAPDVPPPGSVPVVPGFPDGGPPPNGPAGGSWLGDGWQWLGDNVGTFSGNERKLFQSDHCFDEFIAPVSNPFLFLDPRASTEVRPIFMWQGTPEKSVGHGSNIEFFGLSASVAVTDRISFIVSKLGFISVESHDPALESHTGFAEVNIAPQFTFLRDDHTKTLGAFGLMFQIPTGDKDVFQDTGTLSLAPYVTMGQNFGRSSFGSFNALGTLGYSASIDDKRSDYLYTSLHLDYDVANLNKIYPLIELNYLHYTDNGTSQPFGFEGGDLFNFGSEHVSGRNNMTMAIGARYKFTESMQIGSTFEFPLLGTKDLLDFRFMVDMIFRY